MSCTKVTSCAIPACITELVVGTLPDALSETVFVSFRNLATDKVKWVEATTDEDGLLTVDLESVSTFLSVNNPYELMVHNVAGGSCPDYNIKFTLPDGGEVEVDRLQLNFVKSNLEIESFTVSVRAIECCDESGESTVQYVPLSRTLTINGVTFDLSENRSWQVLADTVDWGNIQGTITDQTDLISLLSGYATTSDLNQEIQGRQTGDTNTLASANAYADSLVTTIFRPVGSYDASTGVWPSVGSGAGGAIRRGDVYNVTVAGNIGSEHFDVGDSFYANTNNPGQTDANWSRFESNTQQATESNRGTAKIAGQAEVENPATNNDTDIVTPKKLWFGIAKLLTENSFASAVRSTVLTGLSLLTNAAIDASDTVLSALGKLQAQITALTSGKADLNLTIVTESTTTRLLSASDNGKAIIYTNAAGCTVTLPDTLAAGFNCLHIQRGAAQVTFAGSGSMTVVNADSHTKTAKLNAPVCTLVIAANITNLNGYTGV